MVVLQQFWNPTFLFFPNTMGHSTAHLNRWWCTHYDAHPKIRGKKCYKTYMSPSPRAHRLRAGPNFNLTQVQKSCIVTTHQCIPPIAAAWPRSVYLQTITNVYMHFFGCVASLDLRSVFFFVLFRPPTHKPSRKDESVFFFLILTYFGASASAIECVFGRSLQGAKSQ